MASPSAEDSFPINSVFLDRFPKMACSGDIHPHPAQGFPGVPSVLYSTACFISGTLCPLSFVCFYFLLYNFWTAPGTTLAAILKHRNAVPLLSPSVCF